MKRIISFGMSIIMLTALFACVPANAYGLGTEYLVDMISRNEAVVENSENYNALWCKSSGYSTEDNKFIRIGNSSATGYVDYFHGFRYHSGNASGIKITFTVPNGYNTLSGDFGVCYHVPGPNENKTPFYDEQCSISVSVNDSTKYVSPAIKAHTGYNFNVRCDAGSTVTINVMNGGSNSYAHVVFGDPKLTYEEYPDVSMYLEKKHYKTGSTVTANLTGNDITGNFKYSWFLEGEDTLQTGNSFEVTENAEGKMLKCVLRTESGSYITDDSVFLSTLPVITINTETGKDVTSKVDYINADMNIYGNGKYGEVMQYSGTTEIRGRGNTSWTAFPKKSYKLKLDEKTDLFGMGKNKHWVLISCYWDECFLRNKMSYDLSGKMGMTYMDSVCVDVYLNGRYVGVYLLCEHIRVGSSRVDIFDWEDTASEAAKAIAKKNTSDIPDKSKLEDFMTENLDWITSGKVQYNSKTYTVKDYYDTDLSDITGGYLIEMDTHNDEASHFTTPSGLNFNIKKPEYCSTNSSMTNYIKDYLSAVESACASNDFSTMYNGKKTRYTDLCDLDSMVKWWLINEIFFNWDAGYNSNFMFKDIGGKLQFGPIWDMDITANGYGTSNIYDKWQTWFYKRHQEMNLWFKEVVADPQFIVKAQEIYWQYRGLFNDMVKDGGYMDESYNELHSSGVHNSEIWRWRYGYEKDFSGMKEWLKNRLNWLDEQFKTEQSFISSMASQTSADGVTSTATVTTYSNYSGVNLSVTDLSNKNLLADTSEVAPAAWEVQKGKGIRVKANVTSGNIHHFTLLVNGKTVAIPQVSQNSCTVEIPASEFSNDESKNVVELLGYNFAGGYVSTNYFTVKLVPCKHQNCNYVGIVAATCGKAGYSGDYVCSDCGEIISKGNIVQPTGKHTFGKYVVTKAATYSQTGIMQRKCTVCGKIESVTLSKLKLPVINQATLSAASLSKSVKLSWKNVANATGYRLYMYYGGKYVCVYSGRALSYTKKSLKSGSLYYFKVQAYFASGSAKAYGKFSSAVSCPAALSTPSVTLKAYKSAISVSYKKVSGASYYKIYMASSKNGKYKLIKTTKKLSYKKSGLKHKKKYYFKIKAVKYVGKKAYYSSYSSKKYKAAK